VEEPKPERDANVEAQEALSTTGGLQVTKPSHQSHSQTSDLPSVLQGFSCHFSNPSPHKA